MTSSTPPMPGSASRVGLCGQWNGEQQQEAEEHVDHCVRVK